MESFSKLGIPGRKSEEYKYVNIELLLKGDFKINSTNTITKDDITPFDYLKSAVLIVIENGNFNKELSRLENLSKGLQILNISEAISNSVFQKYYTKQADITSDPFIAMNTALVSGGVFIHVTKGAIIEIPIHILHISSAKENTIVNSRNLIVAEANSQVKMVESYVTINSEAKIFTNALTELVAEEDAIVDHYKIQNENLNGNLLTTTNVLQKKKSILSTNTFTLNGAFVRNNLNLVLDNEYIETHLNGLYLTKGAQVVDNHTLVDHRKPNCNSNELYKGIIDEKSSATFNGKIFVRKDAQKTNAFQSNKNILLSDDGTINTKPQLEIFADDVKCSHGTSTGKLDEDKIFYLRARGLSETGAKKLLMHAFASEVVDFIKIDELKEYIEKKIAERF